MVRENKPGSQRSAPTMKVSRQEVLLLQFEISWRFSSIGLSLEVPCSNVFL